MSDKLEEDIEMVCLLSRDFGNEDKFVEATEKIEQDVKEFIKRLKEVSKIRTEKDDYGFTIMEIPLEVLDKLAGGSLI